MNHEHLDVITVDISDIDINDDAPIIVEQDIDNNNDYAEEENYYNSIERIAYKDPQVIELDISPNILEKYSFLSELPTGVAVMGGVSRSIARELLTNEIEPIRDIDLISVSEYGGNDLSEETRHQLSVKYMPDDYSFGHGMENSSKDNYFRTRDFTINETLVIGNKLLISQQAIDDFKENVIRPTYYEMPTEDHWLNGKLVVKALLMQVMMTNITDSVPCIEDMVVHDDGVPNFYLALGLNKALDRGSDVARKFTASLIEWGMLPQGLIDMPKAAARYLSWAVGDFIFRPSNKKQAFDSVIADLDGYYQPIPKSMKDYYTSDQTIKSAMQEYESPRQGDEEVIQGDYDNNDYKWINGN